MTQTKHHLGAALVTGGAKRIGRSICIKLAEMGFTIALHYNTSKRDATSLANEIHSMGGQCSLFKCNLFNENETLSLISKIKKKHKDLNLLINNASIFEKSNIKNITQKSIQKHFSLHLNAPMLLTKEFALQCSKGQIINMLDTNVTKNNTKHLTYLLSKKSLLEFTKHAALELAPKFRVNAIAPGFILTPENKSEGTARSSKDIPLRKKGRSQNIDLTIQFLIQNTYVTGQVIYVDGGEHLL